MRKRILLAIITLISITTIFHLEHASAREVLVSIAGGHVEEDMPAQNAFINIKGNAGSCAISPSGELYFVDAIYGGNPLIANCVRKIDQYGRISSVAGNGILGYPSIGNLASESSFAQIQDITFDPDGNLLIADSSNARIFKIDGRGIVSVAVGAGTGGDGSPAAKAKLAAPQSITLGPDNSLYIGDASTIRKVDIHGIISTIAGNPNKKGISGDGGAAVNAVLTEPRGIVADSAGRIYFIDPIYDQFGYNTGNNSIRMIDKDGIISTILDGNNPGAYGLNFNDTMSIRDLALNSKDELYLSGYSAIYKRNSTTGALMVILGNSRYGTPNESGPALSSPMCVTYGMTFDQFDNLIFTTGLIIGMVTPSGNLGMIIHRDYSKFITGEHAKGYRLFNPSAMAYAPDGTIYLQDSGRILKIDTSGILGSYAGNGTAIYTSDNTPTAILNTSISGLFTMGVGPDGYVYYQEGPRTRKINTSTGMVETVTPTDAFLAFDKSGLMYVLSPGTAPYSVVIKKRLSDGSFVTYVGSGQTGDPFDGGNALDEPLKSVGGLAFDKDNNGYFTTSNKLFKVANGKVYLMAGSDDSGHSGDSGSAKNALLDTPKSIAVDSTGNIYIAEYYYIRKIDTSNIITTIVGNSDPNKAFGFTIDGVDPLQLKINGIPLALCVDSQDNLTFIEPGRNTIIKLVDTIVTSKSGAVNNGWNLISIPRKPIDPRAASILSGINLSNASLQVWDNGSAGGGYVKILPDWSDPILVGEAYWLISDSTKSISYESIPDGFIQPVIKIPAHVNAPFWVMIGIPKTSNIPISNITFTIPGNPTPVSWEVASKDKGWFETHLQGFDSVSHGYFMVGPDPKLDQKNYLEPWFGYWILIKTPLEMKIYFN